VVKRWPNTINLVLLSCFVLSLKLFQSKGVMKAYSGTLTRPNSPLEIMCKFPYLALTRLNSHYLAETRLLSPLPCGYQIQCARPSLVHQTGPTGKSGPPERWISFFKTFPVGPNRSIDFRTQITRNIGLMDRAQNLIPLSG